MQIINFIFTFFYLLYFFILSHSVFAQNTILQQDLEKISIDISSYQNMNMHKECSISFIPYLQIVLAPLPLDGHGGSLRLHKNHVALQLDCNTAKENYGFFGKFHYLQLSISGIYYPFYKSNDSWLNKCNVTCGVSRIIYSAKMYDKKKCFMLGPLAVGYQGKILFFDVGISAVDLKSLFFYKDVKIGYCIYESIKIGCSF